MSRLLAVVAVVGALGAAGGVQAETVEVYAAGSLRAVVGEMAKEAGPALGVEVKPTFGPAGGMRERIEAGEKPDLLMSADMASPQKLVASGRAVFPVIAFARNRMCIVSRRSLGLTGSNLVDRMLAEDVRVKTSAPIADPGGDYAWAIFDRIDAARPGAGKVLRDKAQSEMAASAPVTVQHPTPAGALFASGQVDLSITYCSAANALVKEEPDLAVTVVPPEFDPHPVYGLAVLSDKPDTMRFVAYLLSEKGQAIVARAGLVPLLAPAN